MAIGRKTGGRKPGSKNKERVVVPEVLPPGTAESMMAETARAIIAAAPVRTPKAVMLDAMVRFEELGLGFLARAQRLSKRGAALDKVQAEAMEGHKYIVAAVECATKVAPYIHARLLAVESRGDNTKDELPYVVRVPTVALDSSEWQNAVGVALLSAQAGGNAAGTRAEDLAHPAQPQATPPAPAPAPPPVVLTADQKTGRISTAMPAAPVTVKPAGSEEWLAQVTGDRRKAVG